MREYDAYDALGLADLVRRREVSAEELLNEAWRRYEACNSKINAIVWANRDIAQRAIKSGLPSGPFHGVPIVVKDIVASVQGFPSTNGSRLFANNVATDDSDLVKRIRAGGFNIFGMSTTPELGMNPTTEAALYGPTRNPWDLTRSPGGSSGGAAAAVAAGIIPLAHASDGAGSIRIPASACGLFGLKPTRGINPMGPNIGETWGGLGVEHAVSRSVRDSAALLDVTAGFDVGAPYASPAPGGTFLSAAMSPPKRLRIGLIERMPGDFPIDPQCLSAVRDTAALCEGLGHTVEQTEYPEYDFEELFRAHLIIVASGTAAAIEAGEKALGRPAREDELEFTIRDAVDFARKHSAVDYGKSIAQFHALGRRMAKLHDTFDVILTPTLARAPEKLGYFATDLPLIEQRRKVSAYSGFLPAANYTGQPAITVPLHWSNEGLPIGSHFIAQMGADRLLFSLAGELEGARPWFNKRPDLS